MLAHHPLITASDRLYFAYGSNLSPEQMAHRCPDSIFLGKATLRGHRWQVNERGVANAVPVPRKDSSKKGQRDEAVVEGLLYAVSAADERRLDRYEGVAKGWYERFEVQVDFEPVRENVFARCTSASVARAVRDEREAGERGAPSVTVGVERRARSWDEAEGDDHQRRRRDHRSRDGGRRGTSVGSSSSTSSSSAAAAISGGFRNSILGLLGLPSKTERVPSPSPAREGRGRERAVGFKPVVALAYASTVHVRDGDIRARYVPRMERAMADAVALGVSRAFVEKQIVPQVWGARPAGKASWRMSLAGAEDGSEKGKREVESVKRRSVSQSDGLRRHGRRDSVAVDRHRD